MALFKGFLLGTVTGIVLAVVAMQYHFVHTQEGMILVRRTQTAPLSSTYVDIRRWSLTMWQQYPEVTAALTKAGRGDLIVEGALQSVLPSQSITVPEPQLPTAQSGEAVVPIRFLDTLGELVPGQSSTPSQGATPTAAPEAIPWEEFLKRASQPASTVPADQAQTVPGPLPGSSLPVSSVSTTSVPNLIRSAVESHSINSVTNQLGTSLDTEARALANDFTSQFLPSGQTVPLPVNTQNAAPQREWVQGVLQTLIPESSIPAVLDRSTLTNTNLAAPLPAGQQPATSIPDLQQQATIQVPSF